MKPEFSQSVKNQTVSKSELTALLASLTALTALSLDTVLPAFGVIAEDFNTADAKPVQYVVILFIFGMVFGELIFGPLSDSSGRKNAILIGLAIYAGGIVIAIFASSIELLLLGRVIQGVGVAGSKIGARAIIRDLYEGAAMAKILSVVFSVLVLVPMLAPLIGQWILGWYNWQAIFFVLLIFCVTIIFWLIIRLDETLDVSDRIPLSFGRLSANAILVLRHPKIMAFIFCAGLIFGTQLLFIALAHSLFVELYQTGDHFPYYFALLGLGTGLGAFINSRLVEKIGMHRMTVAALITILCSSAAFITIGLFFDNKPPFLLFLAVGVSTFFTIGIIIGNINAMAMQSMGRIAGLGSSIIASISSLIAVVFSALVGAAYDGSTLPLASALFAAASISLVMISVAKHLPDRTV